MTWPAPVRLTPRVTLVGSGTLGFGLTDPHDSHVYLVDGGTDAVLVDAGCGLAADRIAANVRACLGARPVSRILLTHAHADHAGGAADLAGLLGATVMALPPVAAIVAAGDEDASGLRTARRAGVYPPGLRPAPVPVRTLEADELSVGALTIGVHPTPGHAAGHCCFSLREAEAEADVEADGDADADADADDGNGNDAGGGSRTLFSGDLVFARGRVAVLATPDTDLQALGQSLRAVAALEPDVLLPGHGAPVLREAHTHLRTAVEHLDRGALPPGLLP
ncbi:MBL fold metallo-hydrolase [Dactylosporangium sp. AC04546]|uniref:MBL fold metallo-hydrolase n=1 Tax=Dactylosporangium sp. AC04546 TaxID=2862460 RepID=UPI001EE129B5|nr:MBL fold metallo-hydrolase [Dactylosporangium sp. AC04546]WVK81043.1 MBL fold metallo-hydrolase [Dactylosporangium sp. AC04546]